MGHDEGDQDETHQAKGWGRGLPPSSTKYGARSPILSNWACLNFSIE